MDRTTAIEVAQYLTMLLKEAGISIDQTILFGSCARDEAHEESDVDIAIISQDFARKDFFERSDMTNLALRKTIGKFLVPIDLLKFTPDELATGTSLALEFVRADAMVVAA